MKKYLKPEKIFSSLLLCMGRSESSEKYIYLFPNCVCCLSWWVVLIMTFCLQVYEFGRPFKIPQSIAGSVPDFSFFFFFLFSCVFRCFFSLSLFLFPLLPFFFCFQRIQTIMTKCYQVIVLLSANWATASLWGIGKSFADDFLACRSSYGSLPRC